MGQKVNPISNRLGIIKGWDSNWFGGKNYADKIVEDERIRNYLNARFVDHSLREIKKKLADEMYHDKQRYDNLLKKALELTEPVISDKETHLYLGGEANFLDQPDFADIQKMKAIFIAFEEKSKIIKILNQCFDDENPEKVRVFIGSETQIEEMADCSIIAANYMRGCESLGTLGVIGPSRMKYWHIISLVDYVAKSMSNILTSM